MDLNQAQTLAQTLMAEHLPNQGWTFGFDRAKSRAGLCSYRKKKITLGREYTLLNGEEAVRETTLHEIAHALVGGAEGHNAVWRRKALSIGSNGLRTTTDEEVAPPGRYTGTCAGGHSLRRHRAVRNWYIYHCVLCRKAGLVGEISWTDTVTGRHLNPSLNEAKPGFAAYTLAAKKTPASSVSTRKPPVRRAPEVGYTDIESLFAGD